MPRKKPDDPRSQPRLRRSPVGLRIIGGRFRGRKLLYSGDLATRPMRDRVREAVFSILRDAVVDARVVDLFAGTGAMGLEAISRGAESVLFVERDRLAAQFVRKNLEQLGLGSRGEVLAADVFAWWKHHPPFQEGPYVVFCCPPYRLYADAGEEMEDLIAGLVREIPPQSVLMIESDDRFDTDRLPRPDLWDVRRYPPTKVAFYWKEGGGDTAA